MRSCAWRTREAASPREPEAAGARGSLDRVNSVLEMTLVRAGLAGVV